MKPYNIVAGCVFAAIAFSANTHAASATTCTVPFNASNGISNGQPAQAAQINSNFSALQACENNVDNTNVGTAGFWASQIIPTTGAQATFAGSQEYTFPSAIQENQGGTIYGIPFDANSTSGSLSAHIEHGRLTTGIFSNGFACAPVHAFERSFTVAPTVVGIMTNGSPYAYIYTNSVTAASFILCGVNTNALSSGTLTIDWIAVGE